MFDLPYMNNSQYCESEYIDITNLSPQNIELKYININNFKSSFNLIKDIYHLDYDILSNNIDDIL
jgi:hypothetical protein